MRKKKSFLIILLTLSLILFQKNTVTRTTADSIYPSSIILFIGDGMGLEQINFGALVEYGEINASSILNFPYNTTVSTLNVDGLTTDSAASATAIATGVKTRNGRISMNWNAEMDLTTILEIAQQNGYATGLVATCHLTHATPACFAAHESSRSRYLNIAEDFSHANVSVMLGGGNGTEYIGNYIPDFISQGYNYITQRADLATVSNIPVLGLFTSGSFPPIQETPENSTIPTLSEMTAKAIELLNDTSQPFFLMVEGSQIDWAGHDNDEVYLAHQIIEFEKAVSYAKDLATLDSDLQVLVTADHETGGFSVEGYNFLTDLPSENDTYTEKQDKRTARAEEIEVKWSTGGHTTREVILAGIGPFTEQIVNASHHIDTFSIMRQAIDGQIEPIGEGFYDGFLPITFAWAFIGIGTITLITLATVLIVKKILKRKKGS